MYDVILGAIVETTQKDITPDLVRKETHNAATSRGYNNREWQCLDLIIKRESHYRHNAKNGSHYGIGQIRGMKPGTGYKHQIKRILDYIDKRYKTACNAYKHHKQNGWY